MEHVDATISPFIFTAKLKEACSIREKKKERERKERKEMDQGDRKGERVRTERVSPPTGN